MENRTTITKQLFMEGLGRISRDGYGKAARKAMLVLLGMWAALLVYTLLSQGNIHQTMGYLVLIGLIGLVLCVFMPQSNAKRAWKALEAKYGSAPERITTFFPDHLEIRGDCVEKNVAYRDVREVKESAHLLILVCEDKTGILLARNGFTGTDANEVKALIESAKNKE